ncbi:MAG: hypothetical protein K2N01_03340 [Lachnospiraceae bacterium]|nr:hypothetical protein [Lachnospiraceae bacterium]
MRKLREKEKPTKIPHEKLTKEKKPRRSLISRLDWVNRFRHWYMGGVSITRSIFRTRAAWQGVLIISIILTILFILAAFYTGPGEFVISLDSAMDRDGFYLSETTDFSERLVTLRGKAVIAADNINIADIAEDVADVDGEHNGLNYVAETFYLINMTGEVKDYEYQLRIRTTTKGADHAMWVMVYHNGKQEIYAMMGEDGEPEAQYSLFDFPFSEDAANPSQYQTAPLAESNINLSDYVADAERGNISSAGKLVATPFVSSRIVCQDVRPGIEDYEIDKYTVVIWYEGEDPECTNDILGGEVELYMQFHYWTPLEPKDNKEKQSDKPSKSLDI